MKPILTMVLSTLLIAWSLPATPLGLGEIDVRSHLGQRFDARIPISTANAEELGAARTATARLAGADEYARAGLELSAALRSLSMSVQPEPVPSVLISSSTPINEPYLEIIVAADSGGQKLLRNYTVLLDPLVGNRNALRTAAPPAATRTTIRAELPGQPPVLTSATRQTAQHPIVTAGPGPQMYGPVRAKETLQSIALAVRPDNRVMIDQTAYAIYKANPQVFTKGLGSRMTGRMLRVPTRNEITAVSAELAQARMTRLREQSVARTTPEPPEKAPSTPAAPVAPTPEQPSGDVAATSTEKPAETSEAPAADADTAITSEGPVVSIYGPVKAGDTLWSIAARMNPDPSIPVRDVLKAIYRANPRAFDGGINGLMKGSTLRIPDADEIRGVRKSAPAETLSESKKPAAPKQDIQPQTSPEPVSDDVAERVPVEAAPIPEGPVEPPTAEAAAPEAASAPAPVAELAETGKEAEKPHFEIRLPKMLEGLEGLKGTDWVDVLLLPLVLITLLASAVLWVIALLRRWAAGRAQPVPAEAPVDVHAPVAAGPFVEIPLSEQTDVPLPEPEPLLPESAASVAAAAPEPAAPEAPAGEIKAVPAQNRLQEQLADAEVNMAFGFYTEAIPVLEQLHAEQPENLDITRKLAKALLMVGRRDAFERLVPPPVEPRLSPEPSQASEPRIEPVPIIPAAPATPLAAPAASIIPVEPPPELASASMVASWTSLAPAYAVPALDPEPERAPIVPANEAEDLAFALDDFELDVPPPAVEAEASVSAPATAADPGMIEFDLSEFDLSPINDASTMPAVDAFDTAETIDFMSPPAEAAAGAPLATPVAEPGPSFESIDLPQLDEFDLDLEDDGHQAFSGDESGTKLDLARAYIEMGDNEMARSLLNEVLQHGDSTQREDARGLLGRLG